MKHIILAPDSFKGTMDAAEICAIQKDVIKKYLPQCRIDTIPMADGGEGMTQSYLRIFGGEEICLRVTGPLGKPVNAAYAIMPDKSAVMEMAAAAGLPLAGKSRDPENATTYGVGEMLLDAQSRGVKKILLGLGGSATNDCGIGMAAALGYRFLDEKGAQIEPLAKNMKLICKIKPPERPFCAEVTAACDVDNPLCGENGATYTFGMQKGAKGEMLARLDAGLKNVSGLMLRDLGADTATVPGAGAAGGLGAGVMAFLGGRLTPGIEMLLDAADFDKLLESCDLVITGEGRADWQSAHGKVPCGIGLRCKKAGVPCIALCGSTGKGAEELYNCGITAIFSAVTGACDFEEIKRSCRDDMRMLTDSLMRTLLCNKGK